MHHKLLSITLALAMIAGLSLQMRSYSDGPPAGRTGAPGELTCNIGYCHSNFPVNPSDAISFISTSIPEEGYLPGETYDVTVGINKPGMQRFGFQWTAVSENTSQGLGEIVNVDDSQTQLTFENEKTYIMHQVAPVVDDSTSWTFQWKAPLSNVEDAVFYMAFVASNNNGFRTGDYVILDTLKVNSQLTTSFQDRLSDQYKLKTYLAGENLVMEGMLENPRPFQLVIMDLGGKSVGSVRIMPHAHEWEWKLPREMLVNGVYLITASNDEFTISRKIAIH